MQYKVYVDGACSGNPGIGGWGVVVIENTKNTFFKSIESVSARTSHLTKINKQFDHIHRPYFH